VRRGKILSSVGTKDKGTATHQRGGFGDRRGFLRIEGRNLLNMSGGTETGNRSLVGEEEKAE